MENLSEKGRRVIFYARYEARMTGCREILPVHLFLGVLRETSYNNNKLKSLFRDFMAIYTPSATPENNTYLAEIKYYKQATTENSEEECDLIAPADPELSEQSRSIIDTVCSKKPYANEMDILHELLGV